MRFFLITMLNEAEVIADAYIRIHGPVTIVTTCTVRTSLSTLISSRISRLLPASLRAGSANSSSTRGH